MDRERQDPRKPMLWVPDDPPLQRCDGLDAVDAEPLAGVSLLDELGQMVVEASSVEGRSCEHVCEVVEGVRRELELGEEGGDVLIA